MANGVRTHWSNFIRIVVRRRGGRTAKMLIPRISVAWLSLSSFRATITRQNRAKNDDLEKTGKNSALADLR
jgi:hypothetical protein